MKATNDFRGRSVAEHADSVRDLLTVALDHLRDSEPELFSISDPALVGRVTATELRSAIDLPPFDNSAMDGYAVRAADLEQATETEPITLTLGTVAAAGSAPLTHEPGTATPIMTGAAMPWGADAVVPIEQAVPAFFPDFKALAGSRDTDEVKFPAQVPQGQFIRRQGEDVVAGTVICPAEALLTSARIGALAAAGIMKVHVRPRARILLCVTGDELVHSAEGSAGSTEPNAVLAPGQIFDSNSPMLSALLRSAGAVVSTFYAADNTVVFEALLREHIADTDIIMTCGGISAGAFEVVREALAPLGVKYGSVAMQPGGPQGLGLIKFAGIDRGIPVICLPGNPVSCWLSTQIFVTPVLREFAMLPSNMERKQYLVTEKVESPAGKLQLRRGIITQDGTVLLSLPGSHLLHNLADSHVIAEIPADITSVPAGTLVDTWRIRD